MKRFFVRCIGTWSCKDSEPMTKEEVENHLKEQLNKMLDETGYTLEEGEWPHDDLPFEAEVDQHSFSYAVSTDDFYQCAYILPENPYPAGSIPWNLEEVRRLTDVASAYMKMYVYDLQSETQEEVFIKLQEIQDEVTRLQQEVLMKQSDNFVLTKDGYIAYPPQSVRVYDSHGADSELNARSGQQCCIKRMLTAKECDIPDVGKMYEVIFDDGSTICAFEDELKPVTEKQE